MRVDDELQIPNAESGELVVTGTDLILGSGAEHDFAPLGAVLAVLLVSYRFTSHLRTGRGRVAEATAARWLKSAALLWPGRN